MNEPEQPPNTIIFKRYPSFEEQIEGMQKDLNISMDEARELYFSILGCSIDLVKSKCDKKEIQLEKEKDD